MTEDPTEDRAEQARREQARAWNALNLILSGVLLWGGLGWLLSEWLDSVLFFAGGLVMGAAAALYLIWIRYGRA